LTRRRLARGIEVARLEIPAPRAPAVPLRAALNDLVNPFRDTGSTRIEFKIVGIAPREAGKFETKVRYEAAARLEGAVVQQTAAWRVDWSPGAENGPPKIDGVQLESFEELRTPAPLFHDRTLGVISEDLWFPRLAFGGNYWYGRTDSLGESNLMGHNGIAIGDANGDGLEDLYVALGTGLSNMLFVQSADGTTREVADEAGVAWLDDTKGVLFADMDNDGDQDLLCAIGPTIVLAMNDGRGKFKRFISMRAPTPAAFYSLSVADYDLDGDLDVYGARYVVERYGISVPMPFHDANNGPTNHLMRNDGEGEFTDVTIAAGLGANNHRFSLIGAWGDYDGDGDPDLYVANDFGRNNLYRNDGGTFVDVAAQAGAEDQAAGMGVSWSDYDLDGDLDIHVTNMFSAAGSRIAYQPRFQAGRDEAVRSEIRNHASGNTLLANQGDGTFRDVSDEAGVRMGRWGWGAKFVDLNNDGYDDIVVPNGFLTGVVEDDL
jgi:hypothetical protein